MCYCFYNQNFKVENLGFKKSKATMANWGIKAIEWVRKPASEALAQSRHFAPDVYKRQLHTILFNSLTFSEIQTACKLTYNDHVKSVSDDLIAERAGFSQLIVKVSPVSYTHLDVYKRQALKEALACPGPIVLDCMIDQDLSVFPMVPAGASIDDIFDEEDKMCIRDRRISKP